MMFYLCGISVANLGGTPNVKLDMGMGCGMSVCLVSTTGPRVVDTTNSLSSPPCTIR